MDLSRLLQNIQETHQWFSKQAARQINTALTLRNWVIGMYLRVYEHEGKDRAQYGEKVLAEISMRLKTAGLKGTSERSLRQYRFFFDCYPQIWQTVSAKFQPNDNQSSRQADNTSYPPYHQGITQSSPSNPRSASS